MDIHKNAKLTPQSRATIVRRVLDQGQPPPRWPSPSGSVPARCASGWSAIRPRVRTDCATAVAATPPAPGTAGGGRGPGRGVAPAPLEWRPRCMCLPPPSVASSAAPDSSDWPPSTRRRPFAATNIRIPAMLHLDIKKLGRFRRAGHRVTHDRRHTSPGAGWDTSMTAWMTIPAWPSPRSTPTRRPPAPPRFSPPRSPTTSISASRSAAC